MPSPEDMLWRAAAAVARRRGVVTDARVDVDEYHRDYIYDDRYRIGPSGGRRQIRVTVTMMVEDLDYTTASAVQLSEIVQRHLPEVHEVSLDAVIEPNPNAVPVGAPPIVSTGNVSVEHVHDAHCNVSRHSPRTPGRSGCSCSPVPTTAPELLPTPAPRPPPTPDPPKEEPMDGSSTRFSLLELDL